MAITPRHLLHLIKKYVPEDQLYLDFPESFRSLIRIGALRDEGAVGILSPRRIPEDPFITGRREKINVPRRLPENDILQENFHQMMSDPDTADIITDMYMKEYPNAPGVEEALNEAVQRKINKMDDKLNALARTTQGQEIIGSTPDFRDLPPRSEIAELNRNLNRLRNEENKAYIYRQMLEGASEFPNMRMRVGDKIRDVSADARSWRLAENLAEGIKKTALNAPLMFLSKYLIDRGFERVPQQVLAE